MNQRHPFWIALSCLTLGAGACASRKEEAAPSAPSASSAPEAQGTPMAPPLTCEMSVPPRLKAGSPVELRFKLSNPTSQTVYPLNWHTPLEGLRNNFLDVTRDGVEIPYQGPMMKRADPSAEAYVAIAPGASQEAQVEVSLAYDFTQPGKYRIAFRGTLMDLVTSPKDVPRKIDQFQSVAVPCPAVETTITPG
ncbi:protease [Stigmatella sp. ncwal1]|uniref:Protease n=1 Tax=Stigmatella ashevillensis TaxID=2995309 RepID=A0ABT5D9Y1_9BACT|nr:protease [Stigmatella ashevillena]MDC0709608.1 protease [Stigmatella ashevillena]